ncbi:major facilitator superfamily domain-containing protein [Bisporella sp. PMI_857]|nr:major facilitator superfamily domain-containing protein [Bisporella sp. PMI_857]
MNSSQQQSHLGTARHGQDLWDSHGSHDETFQRSKGKLDAHLEDGTQEKGKSDLEANHDEDPASTRTSLLDYEDDPQNPRNWPFTRKWAAISAVSCFGFMTSVSSSIAAPALSIIAKDFGIDNGARSQLSLSSFVLGYAIGPLFIGPLSEMYGRAPVLRLANLFYLIFNTACGFSRSNSQIVVFRVLSGMGGSAPLTIGGGVIGDCFAAEERGSAVGIYSLAPLLGPAIGPIAGGFISEKVSWRWVFYSTSIADGLSLLASFILLRETTDNGGRKIAKTALVRRFRLLLTQPITQLLSLYMAYVYGIMYLMLASFPALWNSPNFYNEPVGIGGLNYISLGFGFILGSQVPARFNDMIYFWLKSRAGGIGKPEFRVPSMIIGSFFVPCGLLIYGWTAQKQVHWIGPNIGAALFALGCIMVFQGIQIYLIDAYTLYAASTLAAATVLRSFAGFGFPLFAPHLFNNFGYGWGNSLLALIATVFGLPAPFLLWVYGESLRKRSQYATTS